MPDAYGFNKPNHDALLRIVRERQARPATGVSVEGPGPSRWRPWAIAKAPEDGIPAMTPGEMGNPDTPGSAVCDLYTVNDDIEISQIVDADGNPLQAVIYNFASSIIAEDSYVNFDVDARGRYVIGHPPGGAALMWEAYEPSGTGTISAGANADLTTWSEVVSAAAYDFGFTFDGMNGIITFSRTGYWRVHIDSVIQMSGQTAPAAANCRFDPMHDDGGGYSQIANRVFRPHCNEPNVAGATDNSQQGGVEFLYQFASGDKLKWRVVNFSPGESIDIADTHWTMMPVNQ